MYPYVCGTTYYDEFERAEKTVYMLLYANNFTSAMTQIEHTFGDTLIACDVTCVAEEDTLFEVPKEVAEILIKTNGIYND